MVQRDKYGRSWNLPESELCPQCGQPDSCGDCDHTRLSAEDVALLGGVIDTRAEYTLYVPQRRNNGIDVSAAFFGTLETRLLIIAGGFTRSRGVGGYQMESGEIVREPVYIYTLLAPDTPSVRQQVRSVAQHVKIQLAQESVLFTVRAVDSELV